jgi:hypothetical protein
VDCGTHQNDNSESTGREEQIDPRLDLRDLDVEPGRDDACLVEPAVELHDDFTRAVVVDDLEFADVAWEWGGQCHVLKSELK